MRMAGRVEKGQAPAFGAVRVHDPKIVAVVLRAPSIKRDARSIRAPGGPPAVAGNLAHMGNGDAAVFFTGRRFDGHEQKRKQNADGNRPGRYPTGASHTVQRAACSADILFANSITAFRMSSPARPPSLSTCGPMPLPRKRPAWHGV